MSDQVSTHTSSQLPPGGANDDPSTSMATEASPLASDTWYVITVAAQRAGVHEQTLRHYERLGLISPARRGTRPRSQRLYSARDIDRVIHIRALVDDLGVNLAGVETILNMRDRMEALRREMDQELARLRQEHAGETRRLKALIAKLRG
ncbi:MAG TPA: MerR family transcriptional regulator [Ktedonobacterales bacterium]|jgi:MerR family transcriptional regulator/heat shock protein HspR|nr:MerR family transcriptional regulator [Ktedonobacterales bacterium]